LQSPSDLIHPTLALFNETAHSFDAISTCFSHVRSPTYGWPAQASFSSP